ncbi:hypothetical protein [Oryzifoliimicrobium ureilyticus]|uniref:hypothetical protein n=1 Tax=Oryzifoliimicrobium ureilyticus TaxID=3113724 RepID=UPI003076582C
MAGERRLPSLAELSENFDWDKGILRRYPDGDDQGRNGVWYPYKSRLENEEKQVNIFSKAFGIENKQGPHQSDQNKNAFAHALVSASLATTEGQFLTRNLGKLREHKTWFTDRLKREFGGEPDNNSVKGGLLDGYRDLFNNEVGLKIADYASENNVPRSALPYLVRDALEQGLLIADETRDSRVMTDGHAEAAYSQPSPSGKDTLNHILNSRPFEPLQNVGELYLPVPQHPNWPWDRSNSYELNSRAAEGYK